MRATYEVDDERRRAEGERVDDSSSLTLEEQWEELSVGTLE